MEPTRVRSEHVVSPEENLGTGDDGAHQHAPTLLTSADRSAGDVRVWSPNAWAVRALLVYGLGYLLIAAGGCAIVFFLSTAIPTRDHGNRLALAVDVAFMLAGSVAVQVAGWQAHRRPKYVTTDSHGIAVTTRKGSRAFRWEEITGAVLVGASLTLETSQGRVAAPLVGYLDSTRKDLLATIAQQAKLYCAGQYRCARAEHADSRPPAQPEFAPPSDGPNERQGYDRFTRAIALSLVAALFPWLVCLGLLCLNRAFHAERWRPSDLRAHDPRATLFDMAANVGRWRKVPGGAARSATRRNAAVLIFVTQRRDEGIADASVPGYDVLTSRGAWAPAEFRNAHAPVYFYNLYLRRRGTSTPVPETLRVELDYGRAARWVAVRRSSDHLLRGRLPVRYSIYSNNWGDSPASGIHVGRMVGSLPSLRDWSYGAIGVDRVKGKPDAVRCSFEPTPTVERISANSGETPTAAAAWLPGVVTSRGAWCSIQYSDGTVRRVRIDQAAGKASFMTRRGPGGSRIQWGLTPEENRGVPAHRI